MQKNLQLIKTLIDDVEEMSYHNERKDAVVKRSQMIIRTIFGTDNFHLRDLNSISFTPKYAGSASSTGWIKSFEAGKKQLLNLLKAFEEEIVITHSNQQSIESLPFASQSIFIVHGHNLGAQQMLARVIETIGLKPIILGDEPNEGNTLIEKFEKYSDVGFAVILLTADDKGRSNSQIKLSHRARQNVVLELGYFMGKLGRNRVLPLYIEGVELPSDLHGIVYTVLDNQGSWKYKLVKELRAAGYNVDANLI